MNRLGAARYLRLLVTLTVALLLSVANAAAEAQPQTITVKNQTETFGNVELCGVTGTVTVTYNAVFHITELSGDRYHVTDTLTGTLLIESDSGVTYTGHFTAWDGENVNARNANGTATLTVHATGSDGSRLVFQETAHFSISATGVTVSFDRPRCG